MSANYNLNQFVERDGEEDGADMHSFHRDSKLQGQRGKQKQQGKVAHKQFEGKALTDGRHNYVAGARTQSACSRLGFADEMSGSYKMDQRSWWRIAQEHGFPIYDLL